MPTSVKINRDAVLANMRFLSVRSAELRFSSDLRPIIVTVQPERIGEPPPETVKERRSVEEALADKIVDELAKRIKYTENSLAEMRSYAEVKFNPEDLS